jgi:AraC-like DNA-binding protein
MQWSLSEFLNLIELRGQSWATVELAGNGGFSVPHNDAIFLYAVLGGEAEFSCPPTPTIRLSVDDIIIVTSGDAQAVRGESKGTTRVLEVLQDGEYVDTPSAISLGSGRVAARLLCGRLRVRWPNGKRLPVIPAVLKMTAIDGALDLASVVRLSQGEGGAAILTHAASLLFTIALRNHPQCQQIFESASSSDPVARAVQFIQKHPFRDWTVERLAKKVGMGRSNLAARFVAQVGKTPIEVLTEERMKMAAMFLQSSDLKIAEISARIGYRSEAAFSRRFTDFYGLSPGKMRKSAAAAARPRDKEP